MPYIAYNVGGWVQKEGKICLRNKSMAPNQSMENIIQGRGSVGSMESTDF